MDLWIAIVIAQVCAVPVWLLAPPESSGPMFVGTALGGLLAFAYWAFSPLRFGGTLGKRMFGLRLESADGAPLTAARLLVRILTFGAWPVLALMVLASDTRRHLGDRWARTHVVRVAAPRNLWASIALALLVAVLGQRVAQLGLRVAVLRSHAWATVREHLRDRGPLSWLPVGYHIRDAAAVFSLRAGEQLQRVTLWREHGGAWQVSGSEPIAQDDGSVSIRFGAEPSQSGSAATVTSGPGGDPSEQKQLAAAEQRSGDALQATGKPEEAQAAYARSIAIAEQLSAAEPDDAALLGTLSIGYQRLGQVARVRGELPTAHDALEKSLSVSKRLAALAPTDVGLQRDLSISYRDMGDLFAREKKAAEARTAYEASVEIAQGLTTQVPDNLELQRDLLVTYIEFGDVLWSAEDFARGSASYQSAFAIAQRLADARPSERASRDLERSYKRLSDVTLQAGDVPGARAQAQKALELAQQVNEASPNQRELTVELAHAYAKLAWLERSVGDREAGRAFVGAASALMRELLARWPGDPELRARLAELEQY